jgi:hypothetical protein
MEFFAIRRPQSVLADKSRGQGDRQKDAGKDDGIGHESSSVGMGEHRGLRSRRGAQTLRTAKFARAADVQAAKGATRLECPRSTGF